MKLNVYLNFNGTTETVFEFYQSVFGGTFLALQRFKDVPDLPNRDQMSVEDLEKIMHISLRVGDNTLMGTDVLASQHESVIMGTNVNLSLNTESRDEADRLFTALSADGIIELPLQNMFWGDYFGMFTDQFGIKWMISYSEQTVDTPTV